MKQETEFLKTIADIILSEVENNQYGLTKATICTHGHFSPQRLTRDRLLSMKADTMVRFLLYLAWALPPTVMHRISTNFHVYLTSVADKDDGTVENILNNHAGSPVNSNR